MASSAFVLALIEFAQESAENLASIQELRTKVVASILETPDGALVTQLSGSLNGKFVSFVVDRPASKLLGDLGEVLRTVAGDNVKGTYFNFSEIQH